MTTEMAIRDVADNAPVPGETPSLARWPELRPFIREVVARYGSRLHAVLLYGSRARGDAREDSDYDVAVVLEGEFGFIDEFDWMSDATYDFLVERGTRVQGIPVRAGEIAKPPRPFYSNVAREGVPLWL